VLRKTQTVLVVYFLPKLQDCPLDVSFRRECIIRVPGDPGQCLNGVGFAKPGNFGEDRKEINPRRRVGPIRRVGETARGGGASGKSLGLANRVVE
jgi:hypothetical protein